MFTRGDERIPAENSYARVGIGSASMTLWISRLSLLARESSFGFNMYGGRLDTSTSTMCLTSVASNLKTRNDYSIYSIRLSKFLLIFKVH